MQALLTGGLGGPFLLSGGMGLPDGTDPPHHPDPDETVFTEA